MTEHPAELPAYLADLGGGQTLAFVVSVATFRREGEGGREAITPAVEDALERVRNATGAHLLVSYYLREHAPPELVRRVRSAINQAAGVADCVLWIRADTEHFARAALSVIRADHPVRLVTAAEDIKDCA